MKSNLTPGFVNLTTALKWCSIPRNRHLTSDHRGSCETCLFFLAPRLDLCRTNVLLNAIRNFMAMKEIAVLFATGIDPVFSFLFFLL